MSFHLTLNSDFERQSEVWVPPKYWDWTVPIKNLSLNFEVKNDHYKHNIYYKIEWGVRV